MKGWEILKYLTENPKTTKMWIINGGNARHYIKIADFGYLSWFKMDGNNYGEMVSADSLMANEWEEYKPPVDWDKVPVDTKVVVWNDEQHKLAAHYKGFDKKSNRPFLTYVNGTTSWSIGLQYDDYNDYDEWQYCELAEDDEV